MVKGLAEATKVNSTPTIRINGEDYSPTTPEALIAKIEEIVGNVPALDAGAPPPAAEPTPAASRTRTCAMTVTAPSTVEPSESASAQSTGVCGRQGQRDLGADRRGARPRRRGDAHVEKIEILINPDYVPSCSLNPVLSCGSVMITPQASAFGFPNSLIGYRGVHRRAGDRCARARQSRSAALVLGAAWRSAPCWARCSCTG